MTERKPELIIIAGKILLPREYSSHSTDFFGAVFCYLCCYTVNIEKGVSCALKLLTSFLKCRYSD